MSKRMTLEEALAALVVDATNTAYQAPDLSSALRATTTEWAPRIRQLVEAEIDDRVQALFGSMEEKKHGQPAPDR